MCVCMYVCMRVTHMNTHRLMFTRELSLSVNTIDIVLIYITNIDSIDNIKIQNKTEVTCRSAHESTRQSKIGNRH